MKAKKRVTTKSIIAGIIKDRGYKSQKDVCYEAAIAERTFQYHLANQDFPLSELTRLDAVLHFTDEECCRLIRGV